MSFPLCRCGKQTQRMDAFRCRRCYHNDRIGLPRWPLNLEHLMKFVKKTPSCWIWTGTNGSKGYGTIWSCGRNHYATRLMWEFCNGKIPDGKFICHYCDNPPCVRPSHLWVGTNRDNLIDSHSKGRRKHVKYAKGPNHYRWNPSLH